jgi:hypothetical protein
MGENAWISDEPRFTAVVGRVVARAARRPVTVLAIVLLGTAAFVASRALRPPTYVATLHFRLAEGDLSDPANAPRPPRAIQAYIGTVVLSRGQLQRIMEKHGWGRGLLARNPVAAVDEFREELGIEVNRNYFIYDRAFSDEPRSAYVAISLRGADPERTLGVLHEIGDAILKMQSEHRAEHLSRAVSVVEMQLAVARSRARSLAGLITGLEAEAGRARMTAAIPLRAQIATLQIESQLANEQMVALERRRDALSFSATAESAHLGLTFELFDESVVASSPPLDSLRLATLGAIAFAVLLALIVPAVGTFDDRVYVPGDLKGHGLPVFGAVPRFAGDEVAPRRSRPMTGGV